MIKLTLAMTSDGKVLLQFTSDDKILAMAFLDPADARNIAQQMTTLASHADALHEKPTQQ